MTARVSGNPRIQHGVPHLGRLAFVAALLWAVPAAAQVPNVERGRALYENHCVVCHTPQVHTRENKVAATRAELRRIVDHWRRQQNLTWTTQDVDDVVEFLARTRYRLAPAADRIGTR